MQVRGNNLNKTIFLTGSTGLLGSYLLGKLLQQKDGKIIALSRGKTQEEAELRALQSLKKHFSYSYKTISRFLEIVNGDITEKNLGLAKKTYDSLTEKVTSIFHSAALCDFKVPLATIRKVNVKGTENILEFASLCKRRSRFEALHHISTVAVAGNSKGIFYETDLDIGQSFNNTYERSKFEAEQMAIRYREKGLPVTIYRPAIITGDSRTGYTNNFKMFYQPLQIFSLELFREIPAEGSTLYSLVPVDHVAAAIVSISRDESSRNSTFHIANPNEITLRQFVKAAAGYLKFNEPVLIPREKFDFKRLSPLQLELLKPYIPYLNYELRFDSHHALEILKKTNFRWPKFNKSFLRKIFHFCIQCGFIVPKRRM